jgi:hypothetical protein
MELAKKEHSKCTKIDALQLSSEEWDRVHLFLNLLSVSVLLLKDQWSYYISVLRESSA